MTVGRPITAGRSRDRCVSNVVSNPISDAARAPSPLYRARGQRRPSAASGLPIRNDFGTLSRVDRFQHGESQLSGHDRRCRKQWRIRAYTPISAGNTSLALSLKHAYTGMQARCAPDLTPNWKEPGAMAKQQKSEPVAQPAAEEVVEEQSGPLDAAAKKGWKIANLKTKPKVLIGICSPLIFLAILGGVSGYSINTIVETNKWVDHTREVLAESAAIIGSAVDMETGMRGYLLASEESFLDPYKAGKTAFFEGMQALQETVGDNPAQVERLQETETTIRNWVEQVTEPAIALRRQVSAGTRTFAGRPGPREPKGRKEVLRRLPGPDRGLQRGRKEPDGRTPGDGGRRGNQGLGGSRGHEPERGVGHPHLPGDRAGQRHPRGGGRHGDRHARLSAGRRGRVPGALHGRSQAVL